MPEFLIGAYSFSDLLMIFLLFVTDCVSPSTARRARRHHCLSIDPYRLWAVLRLRIVVRTNSPQKGAFLVSKTGQVSVSRDIFSVSAQKWPQSAIARCFRHPVSTSEHRKQGVTGRCQKQPPLCTTKAHLKRDFVQLVNGHITSSMRNLVSSRLSGGSVELEISKDDNLESVLGQVRRGIIGYLKGVSDGLFLFSDSRKKLSRYVSAYDISIELNLLIEKNRIAVKQAIPRKYCLA